MLNAWISMTYIHDRLHGPTVHLSWVVIRGKGTWLLKPENVKSIKKNVIVSNTCTFVLFVRYNLYQDILGSWVRKAFLIFSAKIFTPDQYKSTTFSSKVLVISVYNHYHLILQAVLNTLQVIQQLTAHKAE